MVKGMLAESVVQTRGNGKSRKSQSRKGYVDVNGQVFLPPLSEKREKAWKDKMFGLGYTFVQ